MALKIQPTPLLTGNSASRISSIIKATDKVVTNLSNDIVAAKKRALDNILKDAKI